MATRTVQDHRFTPDTRHGRRAGRTGVLAIVTLVLLSLASVLPARASGPLLLFEPATGRVLFADEPDLLWRPASLTKIMTAYMTFEAIKAGRITLETKLTSTEKALAQAPSKLGLPVGGQISVELGLKALIIKSANDVAVMLAEGVAGSEEAFVEQMNVTAKRLGMTRTRFANPNGLPHPEQVTTARDLARLSLAVVRDFPQYAPMWSEHQMQLGKRRLGSHNGLLRTFEGADGLKTGFTCDSGFNVVASASRAGKQLMAVVLGEPSVHWRSLRAATMLDLGFEHYAWKRYLGMPTLDSLPVSAESVAKGVTSVRTSVTSWNCNGKRPVAKRVKPKAAPVSGAKVKGGKQAEAEPAAAPAAAPARAVSAPAMGAASALAPQEAPARVRPLQRPSN